MAKAGSEKATTPVHESGCPPAARLGRCDLRSGYFVNAEHNKVGRHGMGHGTWSAHGPRPLLMVHRSCQLRNVTKLARRLNRSCGFMVRQHAVNPVAVWHGVLFSIHQLHGLSPRLHRYISVVAGYLDCKSEREIRALHCADCCCCFSVSTHFSLASA